MDLKASFKYGLYVNPTKGPSESDGLVFIKTGKRGRKFKLEHGRQEKSIDPKFWNPVQGDGLLVGDLVQIISPDSKNKTSIAEISRMEWSYEFEKISYTLLDQAGMLVEQYFIEDLTKWESRRTEQLNPELEALINNNPNDQSAWAVYGDWLQSKDDPLGEFIALEIAFQNDPENLDLIKRRTGMIRNHQKVAQWELYKAAGLLPGEYPVIKLEWFTGFLRKASIQLSPGKIKFGSTNNMLPQLLNSETAKFLYDLKINNLNDSYLKPLLNCAPLLALRNLTLENNVITDMNEVFLNMPNLERLRIKNPTDLLVNLKHKHLKSLEMDIIISHLKYLARGHLPQLETLELRFHNQKAIRSTNLKELTESKTLPHLKSLLIRDYRSEKKAIVFESIFPSAMVDRLDKLLLEVYNLVEINADYFIKHRQSIEHLKELKILYRVADGASIRKLRHYFDERLILKRLV